MPTNKRKLNSTPSPRKRGSTSGSSSSPPRTSTSPPERKMRLSSSTSPLQGAGLAGRAQRASASGSSPSPRSPSPPSSPWRQFEVERLGSEWQHQLGDPVDCQGDDDVVTLAPLGGYDQITGARELVLRLPNPNPGGHCVNASTMRALMERYSDRRVDHDGRHFTSFTNPMNRQTLTASNSPRERAMIAAFEHYAYLSTRQAPINDRILWEGVAQKFDDGAASLDARIPRHYSDTLRGVAARIRESLGGKSLDLNVMGRSAPGNGGLLFYVAYQGIHLAWILKAIKGSKFLDEVKMILGRGAIGNVNFEPLFLDAMRHTSLTHLKVNISELSDWDNEVIRQAVVENAPRLRITELPPRETVRLHSLGARPTFAGSI